MLTPRTNLAATLKNGDHLEIQGQLRTRGYAKDNEKKTVTEIRVTPILKLGRGHIQAAAQAGMREVA
jgi:single-stranded DNA-binding protein